MSGTKTHAACTIPKTESDYLYGWIKKKKTTTCHMRKNLTHYGEPQRNNWERRRRGIRKDLPVRKQNMLSLNVSGLCDFRPNCCKGAHSCPYRSFMHKTSLLQFLPLFLPANPLPMTHVQTQARTHSHMHKEHMLTHMFVHVHSHKLSPSVCLPLLIFCLPL